VSVSAWSRREAKVDAPGICEKEAVKLLRDVGGDREWWHWNPVALVGHLRVAVTEAEHGLLPSGVAVDDAGESGPERKRAR
jgi:hypothetical protein